MTRRGLIAASGAMSVLMAACAGQAPAQPAAGEPAKPPAAAPISAGPAVGAAPAPPPVATPPLLVAPPTPTAELLNRFATAELTATVAIVPTAMPTSPTAVPSPTALTYDAARLKERLGSSTTSYAGSIAERAWNVELAVKRLDGTRIAPGEVFSFNKAVGPTTLKAGFRIGYGITMKDGEPETIPSVAGGICQVATTIYQAAFWAGLPYVERHHHLYWIPRYGQPPSGRTGMDATVDDPGVDLKFKNTTGDFLRLDGSTDGANVKFAIVGVEPGWDVELVQPRVYDVVNKNEEPVRQDDPTMPAGKEIRVEHAEDGFKVTVGRVVKHKGKVISELSYTNRYLPAGNVWLVGTKGATPKASPMPDAHGTVLATPTPARHQVTATPTPPPVQTRLANGQVRVPALVGQPEAQARRVVDQAGLANTYTNYQGPGQVPPNIVNTVAVGSVISQNPAPGTVVAAGTTIFLAVRRA